jgi:ACS family hexuronate transporter-like MFS transporter
MGNLCHAVFCYHGKLSRQQVLSLTWKDFIAPEFHWTNVHYGNITALFSIMYAVCMLFAGRIVDRLDTKNGYLWAIVSGQSEPVCMRCAEWPPKPGWDWTVRQPYVPQRNRSCSQDHLCECYPVCCCQECPGAGRSGKLSGSHQGNGRIFSQKRPGFLNKYFQCRSHWGALVAPVTIPAIASKFGWEMAFIIIGVLGFVWMGFWVFVYKKPHVHPKVNAVELAYIQQDGEDVAVRGKTLLPQQKISFWKCFTFRQTWAFAAGKFMTDGVWWFFLFWTPAYLSSVYGLPSDNPTAQALIFVLYAITLLSIVGGWLPTFFVNKKGMPPYEGRMRAMLIFAVFPLLAMFAQAAGPLFILDPVNNHWYCGCCPPGMVCQFVLYHWRYVSQKRHCDHHRHRRYGGWNCILYY